MATKKYESLRIMSLEGSVVFKNDGFTATTSKYGNDVPMTTYHRQLYFSH